MFTTCGKLAADFEVALLLYLSIENGELHSWYISRKKSSTDLL